MPVHFLDLAAAVEKLRWAEKEWRELDQELATDQAGLVSSDDEEEEDEDSELVEAAISN